MAKKKKHEKEQDYEKMNAFLLLNAIDMGIMLDERIDEKWDADKHTAIENYLHYRAEVCGR